MLKEVAREHYIQGLIREFPYIRTILGKKRHFRVKLASGTRIQVHSILAHTLDVVDEFPVSTAEIQNRRLWGNVSLKPMTDETLPNLSAIDFHRPETVPVDHFQLGLKFEVLFTHL